MALVIWHLLPFHAVQRSPAGAGQGQRAFRPAIPGGLSIIADFGGNGALGNAVRYSDYLANGGWHKTSQARYGGRWR